MWRVGDMDRQSRMNTNILFFFFRKIPSFAISLYVTPMQYARTSQTQSAFSPERNKKQLFIS